MMTKPYVPSLDRLRVVDAVHAAADVPRRADRAPRDRSDARGADVLPAPPAAAAGPQAWPERVRSAANR